MPVTISTQFAELTWPQVTELRERELTPVLLLPVGAVEPHGPHAPLGTDTIISVAVCERAAAQLAGHARVRAYTLPAVAYGVTRYSRAFAGFAGISEDTLHALVVDLCTDLREQGFVHVVVVNSHFEPEHVAALRRATADTGTVFFDVTRRHLAERLTEEFRSGAAHAGRYETSLVLAIAPSRIDVERARALPALEVDMPAEMAAGRRDFVAMGMRDAYCGAPAAATADEGEETLAVLASMLAELVEQRAA